MTKPLLIGTSSCALLAIALISAWMGANYELANDIPPVIGKAPQFELTDQHKNKYGSKELAGKAYVLNFFFSSCNGPCPAMNAEVASIASDYTSDDTIKFVSVSVDPEVDTPEVLNKYAQKIGALGNWHFLTGDFEDIRELGVAVEMPSVNEPASHNTKLILIDQNNFIRGYYNSFDYGSRQHLQKAIRALIRNH